METSQSDSTLDVYTTSVTAPDFQYRPSANPYFERIQKQAPLSYTHQDTEKFRGQWKRANETTRLVVEIGCNGGHVLNERAAKDPSTHFVGIDWKFKQIYLAADKAARRSLSNTTYLRANAQRLNYIFDDAEIDELDIYFPDPWPKRAQRQNRLLSRDWLTSVAPLLNTGAIVHFKTDHREYFDTVLSEIADHPKYDQVSLSFDKHAGNPQAIKLGFPAVTLFERLFIKDGLPIHELILRKKPLEF